MAAAQQVNEDRVRQIDAEAAFGQALQQPGMLRRPGRETPAECKDKADGQRRGELQIPVVYVDGLPGRDGAVPVERGEAEQRRKRGKTQKGKRLSGEPPLRQKPAKEHVDQIAQVFQAIGEQQRGKPGGLFGDGAERGQTDHDTGQQQRALPDVFPFPVRETVQQRQRAVAEGDGRQEPQMVIAGEDETGEIRLRRPKVQEAQVKDAIEQGPEIIQQQEMQQTAQVAAKVQRRAPQQQRPAEHEEQRHAETDGEAEKIPEAPDGRGGIKVPEQHDRMDRHDGDAGDDAAQVEFGFSHARPSPLESFTTIRSPSFFTEPA